ncbi:hypothetical protein BH11MYX2_BH11MYX2_40320 [soil metagenome]
MRSFMTISVACMLAAATYACGGSKPATNNGTGPGSEQAVETCCCKSNPLTSEDGSPVFEPGNRMECGSKQGTCVDDVQCQNTAQPD